MINQAHLKNAVIVAFLTVALSACGFHLRGNIPLPDGVKNMYITGPSGTFLDQLEDVLVNAGAVIASSEAGSDVLLSVIKVESKRSVGTLDQRGKVNSYNFELTVKYELLDPAGDVIRDANLRETRRYDFRAEAVIESESEEAELLEDMEESIAFRVVRQLSSLTDYPHSAEASEVDEADAADEDDNAE
jgi:LPS-assembly lipoprotein